MSIAPLQKTLTQLLKSIFISKKYSLRSFLKNRIRVNQLRLAQIITYTVIIATIIVFILSTNLPTSRANTIYLPIITQLTLTGDTVLDAPALLSKTLRSFNPITTTTSGGASGTVAVPQGYNNVRLIVGYEFPTSLGVTNCNHRS